MIEGKEGSQLALGSIYRKDEQIDVKCGKYWPLKWACTCIENMPERWT
jgi:hypothetical protein